MSGNNLIKPSRAPNPDLDWSQVQETVLMLNAAVAQLENALRSGDESVNTLANSFTSMVGNVEVVHAAATQLPESNETNVINEHCQAVSEKMRAAIVAFQFYDKLTQRLTHLSNSLGDLAQLVADPVKLYNPYAWHGLQEKIKSKYTVESDRAMFDAILRGHSVNEALAQCEKTENKLDNGDDVELF
jgi:hypothetical protein